MSSAGIVEVRLDFTGRKPDSAALISSPLLADLPHGFGHRLAPVPFREEWEKIRPQWKQVHGTAIAEATDSGAACGEVDGLWTRTSGQWVGAVTADCVPILAARKDGAAVAGLHAGWRGTLAGIALRFNELLGASGEKPFEWRAAIGPSIGPCCFEVSEEIASRFIAEFSERLGASREEVSPRHRILDLQWINALQLRHAGFAEVEILRGTCTKCASWNDGSPVFHSYRREGGGTRQLSIIRTKALTPG